MRDPQGPALLVEDLVEVVAHAEAVLGIDLVVPLHPPIRKPNQGPSAPPQTARTW